MGSDKLKFLTLLEPVIWAIPCNSNPRVAPSLPKEGFRRFDANPENVLSISISVEIIKALSSLHLYLSSSIQTTSLRPKVPRQSSLLVLISHSLIRAAHITFFSRVDKLPFDERY
jgi:hypothetical protein